MSNYIHSCFAFSLLSLSTVCCFGPTSLGAADVLASTKPDGQQLTTAAKAEPGIAKDAKAMTNRWETTASLGLTLSRGNSDTVLGVISLDTRRKWPKDELTLGLSGSYGEVNSVKNQEILHGHAQYNRHLSERFYGGLRSDGIYDGIAGVDYRFKASPLAGYYAIKNPKTFLAFEIGPSVVFEKFRGGDQKTFLGFRLGERLEHKISDRAKLWQSCEYIPQVDRWTEKYLIHAELGIQADVTTKIALRTVLQDMYDSYPSQGRKNNDLRLIAGITYKF